MNKFNMKNSRAFTLVETLVAIAILMISVSGPLAVANKALTASLYAKDQSTAAFLAQEEMEIIKNIKDNNAGTNNPWLGQGLSNCLGGAKCDFVVSSGSLVSTYICPNLTTGCQLYTDGNGFYTDSSSGSRTVFSRYFVLSGNSCTVGGSECQAQVVVSWNEGTVPNAVTLYSELTKIAP